MEFNEKIQALRKRRGLTQEELAEALFVSRTAISKWESGRGYPNIDSLKAIAKFFSVSIDELLSGDEALTIAEEENRQKEMRLRDLVFGLLDLSAALCFVLPLFGQKEEGAVRAVALSALGGIAPYLRIAYYVAILAISAAGILTLALQNCQSALWKRIRTQTSFVLNTCGALLFIISAQSYAAAFLFGILMIKACVLAKRR